MSVHDESLGDHVDGVVAALSELRQTVERLAVPARAGAFVEAQVAPDDLAGQARGSVELQFDQLGAQLAIDAESARRALRQCREALRRRNQYGGERYECNRQSGGKTHGKTLHRSLP